MAQMWMVRAGRRARFLDDFKEKSVVAIGWTELEFDLSTLKSKDELSEAIKAVWPESSPAKIRMAASQIFRFARKIQIGDQVLTYDPQERVYLLGEIISDYLNKPGVVADWRHIRRVKWESQVERDLLSTTTRNSLGAISTLFKVPEDAANEIVGVAAGEVKPAMATIEEPDDDVDLLEDIEERASEFIKDRISQLEWEDMQELVAGLLRAMGYKANVSAAGPDRGKDIVASPDGFGFESPRIVVEVKHRKGAMGSQAIRSFLGGRHKDDKGLYVSTGGFSKDAHYEAERANIPITLLNLDDLVDTMIDYYEKLDPEVQRLVPLKRVYWPV